MAGGKTAAIRLQRHCGVDYKEARVMRRAGLPVAHQGIWYKSLVIRLLTPLNRAPTYHRVYSRQSAGSFCGSGEGRRVQSVLLKVYSDDDFLYPGQRAVLYSIRCTRWLLKLRNCRVAFSWTNPFPLPALG